jgi:hypothetical protein
MYVDGSGADAVTRADREPQRLRTYQPWIAGEGAYAGSDLIAKRLDRGTDQCGGCMPKHRLGIRADVRDIETRFGEDEQRPVRLNGARTVNELALTVR